MKEFIPDFEKMNIMNILEHPNVCDDNFFLFPSKYLPIFIDMLESSDLDCPLSIHWLKPVIEEKMIC
jgi:hypothetical protein